MKNFSIEFDKRMLEVTETILQAKGHSPVVDQSSVYKENVFGSFHFPEPFVSCWTSIISKFDINVKTSVIIIQAPNSVKIF